MADLCFVNAAAERNKDHILQVLKKHISAYINEETSYRKFRCLEISSGSGQHVAHFAPEFPRVVFQPSEYDKSMFDSIRAYVDKHKLQNVNPPVFINAQDDIGLCDASDFTQTCSVDFVININMIHVSPLRCAQGLFKSAGQILRSGGYLFTYGAYGFDGKIVPDSNVRFDAQLRDQNPQWGIRDVGTVLVPMATEAGLQLVETVLLPANNHVLVWKRK